jgi:hypothetical protein
MSGKKSEGPKSKSGKRKAKRRLMMVPIVAYSKPTFCAAHGISESFYEKLRKAGLGPQETRLGARVLITQEAAARWRAEREAETTAKRQHEQAAARAEASA